MDSISIEILEDGSLKITTDKISMANHGNADALIRELIKSAGGDCSMQRKTAHIHHHNHIHEH